MKEAIRNRTNFYIFLALILTTSLMFLKKSNIPEVLNNRIIPRNLLEQSKKNYVCDKAGSRLTDKYKSGFNEDSIKKESLSDAQQSIIDFIRDQKYDNIKPYIKHCAIFIVFIVLDIIFIFLWISYCCCCCCSCCLFSTAEPNRCCSLIFFLISVICNIIVAIISIIVLGVLNSFFSRLNGVGCSAYYFIDHVQLGLAPSYPNHQSEWEGLNGLLTKLRNTQAQANSAKGQIDTLSTSITARNDEYGEGKQCHDQYVALKNNVNEINNLLEDSFDALTDSGAINDLEEVRKTIQDAEDDAGDTIYDSMHDHTNKWAKRIFIAVFTLTLIFSLLAIVILFLYFCFKSTIFRIIYVVIWNISMLLMILTILEGVSFGIVGYIFSDAVQVGNYILSSENLKSTDPIIFENSDNYTSNLIDTCANGDGNFTKVVEGGNKLNQNLENWKQNRENYITTKNNINCNDDTKTNQLKNYYDQLISVIDQSLEMTYNITNVSCSFAKNDKNIFLNEADTGGIKGIGLCACSFLVGIFLGISVVAGILLVHKYQLPSNNNERNKNMNNTDINESRENIRQGNNAQNPNMMFQNK